jgi:hypothetical protein
MSYIGNAPISAAFLTDTFSGTGSQTAYTMTVAPANTSSIIVAITGVLQDPSTYSVSGTTLTFSAAPPSGTSNISVRYLGIPATGVTTTAYRTVTEFTATSGQTSFSVPSYTVGYIDVYRNGVMLGTADFTATTGTTVVLATGATTGDLIRTESFYVSSVLNAIPATASSISLTSATYLSGILPVAYGGTGVATSTGSGAVVLGTSPTLTSPTITGAVVSSMASSVLTSGTAQASTSGTSIDFTGIPSWAKRITVMFQGVSTNGSSVHIMRLGTSSGFATSGYASGGIYTGSSTGSGNRTDGLLLDGNATDAGVVLQGHAILTNIAGNAWVQSFVFGQSNSAYAVMGGGSITLGSALTQIRITMVNGTDTFDAGLINILYE